LGGFEARHRFLVYSRVARPGSRAREWNGRKRPVNGVRSCLLRRSHIHVPVLSVPPEHGTRLHRVLGLRNAPGFYSLSVCPFEHCDWIFRPLLWPLLYRCRTLNQ
jgi:hypothetical protein